MLTLSVAKFWDYETNAQMDTLDIPGIPLFARDKCIQASTLWLSF